MLQMPPAALISSAYFSTSPVNQTLGAPVFSPLTFRTRPGRLPNRALMVARSGAGAFFSTWAKL